jgi:nucleotide-binding universal stress UspA family protein
MYEKILVPLDGSNIAESVLPYAKEFAVKFDAEIALFGVYESGATYTENLYRSYLTAISSKVKYDLNDLGTKEPKVRIEVISGKPADEILLYADKENITLVILASHGSSGESPGILGSIAVRVLRIASKPVLIIRSPADDDAVKQKRLLKKILVPLDGSKVGETALPHAEALAYKLKAELVLLHVVEPAPSLPTDPLSAAYRARNKEVEKTAFDYIKGIEKSLTTKGLIASGVVLAGYPADEIIKYSVEKAVDLIAMSTHGRSGISRWAIGSVTDKILHHGTIPVLVEHAII